MLTPRTGSHSSASPSAPPSIEDIRRRARHRLIGAAVLVGLAVLGFPLLFDTQPRPIAVDIPIEIPARQSAEAPASALPTVAPTAQSPVTATASTPPATDAVPTQESLAEREEVVVAAPSVAEPVPAEQDEAPLTRRSSVSGSPAKTLPRPEVATPAVTAAGVATPSAPPASPVPAAPVAAKPSAPAVAPRGESAVAAGGTAAPSERVIVQVGAFADQARAQEVRWKLERAGMKTYTHVAETAEGRRIRVRLGPFATRADAEKAAERAKALGLSVAILTL